MERGEKRRPGQKGKEEKRRATRVVEVEFESWSGDE
jgi:hypothetical protein